MNRDDDRARDGGRHSRYRGGGAHGIAVWIGRFYVADWAWWMVDR